MAAARMPPILIVIVVVLVRVPVISAQPV
jgi:hypothetical protein